MLASQSLAQLSLTRWSLTVGRNSQADVMSYSAPAPPIAALISAHRVTRDGLFNCFTAIYTVTVLASVITLPACCQSLDRTDTPSHLIHTKQPASQTGPRHCCRSAILSSLNHKTITFQPHSRWSLMTRDCVAFNGPKSRGRWNKVGCKGLGEEVPRTWSSFVSACLMNALWMHWLKCTIKTHCRLALRRYPCLPYKI